MSLTEAHLRGIEKRGLNPETAIRMGLYSGRRLPDGRIEADENGTDLCFPYFEDGKEINTKARFKNRDGEKDYRMQPGAPKTFFNADILFDEAVMLELETGVARLIITEGEFDTLAAIDGGWAYAISVPNGAPPARDKNGRLIEVPSDTRDLDPENDIAFSYIGRLWEKLERVKEITVATDADEPGGRLSKELVRRLGPARCFWVDYPKVPCVPFFDEEAGDFSKRNPKDLNEVLQYLGADAVDDVLQNVKQWPIKGLFKFSDYPDQGEPITYATHVSPDLDDIFRLYPGAFVVATGIPNMGKSEIVKQIMVNMADHHGWPAVYFPGEEPVKPYLFNSLRTKYLKKPKSDWTGEDILRADHFLEKYIQIIGNDPRDEEEEIDLDFLLDRAMDAVFRAGAKLLIIDPWNELEHNFGRDSETEYIGRAIRKLKRFGRSFGICIIIVAHPRKVDTCPGLYDINGSANWANKADLGLVVHSDNPFGTHRECIVPKCRFKAAGRKGQVDLEFDRDLEMYMPVDNLVTMAEREAA